MTCVIFLDEWHGSFYTALCCFKCGFFTCMYTLHFQPVVKNVFVFCSIEKHFLSAIISLWIFLYLALLFFYAFLLPRSSEIEALKLTLHM